MSISKAMKKAEDDKDVEAMMSFYHEDFEFVSHKFGSSLTKPEFKAMCIKMFAYASKARTTPLSATVHLHTPPSHRTKPRWPGRLYLFYCCPEVIW